MPENPYATPEHYEPPREAAPGAIEPGPWEIGEVLSAGWRLFVPHWPTLVLSAFIAGTLTMLPVLVASGMAGWSAARGDPPNSLPLEIAGFAAGVATMLLQAVFEPGVVTQWLTAARGGAPSIGQLFSSLRFFPAMLGMRAILAAPGLAVSAMKVANASLGLGMTEIVLGGVFSVLIGLGLSLLYALGLLFAGFHIVDRGAGPIEALRGSWASTAGQRGKIFLLSLVVGVVGSLGYFACLIGLFASLPVAGLAVTVAYLRQGYAPRGR